MQTDSRKSVHISLRLQMTAGIIILLSVILMIFASLIIKERIKYTLFNLADSALNVAALQAPDLISWDNGQMAFRRNRPLEELSRTFDLYLINGNGQVVDSAGIGDCPVAEDLTPGYQNLEADYAYREDEWRVYIIELETGNETGTAYLQIAQQLDYDEKLLGKMIFQTVITALVLVVIGGGGSILLSHIILKPVKQIAETAGQIRLDSLNDRIEVKGIGNEVHQLADILNQMLDRLSESYKREHQFLSDTAHELRTPLTSFRGQLEVLLQKERTPAEYIEGLSVLVKESDRMISLTTGLLALSRLENNHRIEKDSYKLKEHMDLIIENLKPKGDKMNIRFENNIPKQAVIHASFDLSIVLFTNLIDNAIKYNIPDGSITIDFRKDDKWNIITISDTGIGIHPEDQPFIFDRLFQVDKARQKHNASQQDFFSGFGLGLSIAKKIAELHSGRISVNSNDKQGSAFTVYFPQK